MDTNNYVPEIYIGENGNWFVNGSDTGQPSRGPQGKSAYEIAVTFGYQGTEAEWLSGLKGEQGLKGDKGAKGDPGAVGPQGVQGPKGDIDAINDQTPTYTMALNLTQLSSGEKVSVAFGKIARAVSSLINHVASKANESVMGHVKLSKSLSVTETGIYALDAIERNAGVVGTLANKVEICDSKLEPVNIPITCFDFVDNYNPSRTKLIKFNRKMTLFIAGYNTVAGSDLSYIICTVPEDYRPSTPAVGILTTLDGKSTPVAMKEDGKVYIKLEYNNNTLPQYTWLFGELNWYI